MTTNPSIDSSYESQDNFVDYDDLDFQQHFEQNEAVEPLPELNSFGTQALAKRKKSKRRKHEDPVQEFKATQKELKRRIREICKDDEMSSEEKSDLIKLAARDLGINLGETRIIQELLDFHLNEKFGSDLVVINSEQGHDWFSGEESHIIDSIIPKGELNILAGLTGASKTILQSIMCAHILDPEKEPYFLGYKINRELVNQIFFIGLDGNKTIYCPYFKKAGLIKEDNRPIPRFNFIPSESGWGITSKNLDKLESKLKNNPNSIVIVDSLVASVSNTGVDENSSQMAARLMDLRGLCEKYDCTPIILAHQKKEATQDFTGADSLRGHSSIPCFAGQIITLNMLDAKTKVNGKAVPDRKNPKRRLVAGHRGAPIDLLIEIDFDEFEIKTHGDFYDALFAAQTEMEDLLEVATNPRAVMDSWSPTMKAVFDCLWEQEHPIDQAEIVSLLGLSKGAVSKAVNRLIAERFRNHAFVEVVPAERMVYWVNDFIKAEVNAYY